jgi:hypothetical protein
MSRLDQTCQLGCGDKGNVSHAFPAHDNDLLRIHHVVQNAGEILAQTGIGRFSQHHALLLILYRIPVLILPGLDAFLE